MTPAPRTCYCLKRSQALRSWRPHIAKPSTTDTCGTSSATARCYCLAPGDPADQPVAHGVHLFACLVAIRRTRDEQRRLVERPEQHVRGRPQRLLGYGTLGDRMGEHSLDHPEAVLDPDAAPLIPAEHRRRIDQDDPLHVGCRTAIQEKPRA